MKQLILFSILILITLNFAQNSGKSIPIPVDGMTSLCSSSKALLAVFFMLLLISAFVLFAIRELIEQFAKGNKMLVWLAPKLRALAVICFAFAVIGIMIYLAIPPIISYLLGPTISDPCDYQQIQPECNNTGNKTCIMYAMKSLS